MRNLSMLAIGGAALACCFVVPGRVTSQTIAIAPQVIVVDARTRSAAVTLINTGTTTSEVTLSTMFGYPVTDAAGFMLLHTMDAIPDSVPSIAPYIQVFPARLRLAPNERRVVRIMVSPPKMLIDREYWARLVVAARGGEMPITGTENSNVKAGLAIEIRSVLPFFYRKGVSTTGVMISNARTSVHLDSLVVRAELQRTGNSAFIGALSATLRDAQGKVAAKTSLPLGVYYTLDPRLPISLKGLKGKYELVLEAVSARPDVPGQLLVKAPSVKSSTTVVIP